MLKNIRKNKIFKLLAFLQIVFLMAPLLIAPAKADTISNADSFVDPMTKAIHNSALDVTKQVLKEVLKEFGLSEDQFGNIGESMNVWENKKNAPEVQLLFNPASPKVAEEITATALPKFFQSTKENLYFTWYLKHDKCKTTKNKNSDKYVESCDLNYDDLVNIEDYKIEAMREIAKGGFDKNKVKTPVTKDDEDGFGTLEDYAKSGVITDDVCDDLSISLDSPLPTSDCDGGNGTQEDISAMCDNAKENPVEVCTKAPFGGFNAKQPTGGFRCYVKDYEDGVFYEMVEESLSAGGGKSGCTVTVDGEDGVEYEPYDDGRAIFRFTQKGGSYSNPVTVEISGCDNGIDDYSETFDNPGDADDCDSDPNDEGRHWLEDGSLWKGNSESNCNLVILLANKYTEGVEGEDGESENYHHYNPAAWDGDGIAIVLCEDSPEMTSCEITSSLLGNLGELTKHSQKDKCREVFTFYNYNGGALTGAPMTISCVSGSGTYIYEIADGGTYETDDATCSCEEGEETVTGDAGSSCTHLFPHATYEEDTGDYNAGDVRFVTGDGYFDVEEEAFWETNPEDPDTAGDGIGDEAAIAGVGRDKFTWTYNKGDKVGVAVEGNSTNPTKHDDSSYMVMWALPNNNFDVKSTKCKIRDKGSYTKNINDREVEIATAEIDINACLEENLVDPLESPAGGAPAKNLEVDLSYSPAKPFNDNDGSRGSNVVVQSILANSDTNDSRDVYYKWTIFGKSDTDFMGDWGDSIEGDLDIGTTEGLNKESIDFNLNLDDNSSAHGSIFGGGTQGYIKVVLDVEENYGSGMTKSGKGEKIIKVTTGNNSQINLYEAQHSNGSLTINTADNDSKLCLSDDGINEYYYCPIVENLIVGAQLDPGVASGLRNFSWTLNGEPLECTSEMSSLCSDTVQGRSVFFTATGKENEVYTLTAVANDVDPDSSAANQGERTEITQMFQILKPIVELGPSGGVDEETCESEEGGFNAKDMGDFKDIANDGELIKECSSNVFNAQSGTLNIQATFNPSFVGRHIKEIYEAKTTDEERDEVIVMSVNGERVDINFADNGIIDATYEANDVVPGDSINVSISGTYAQSREMKRILNNAFKISQFDMSESKLSDSIKIKIEESDVVGVKKSVKTMASLISNLPTQMLFLFRVMLTVATVIFISGTVFALGKQGV